MLRQFHLRLAPACQRCQYQKLTSSQTPGDYGRLPLYAGGIDIDIAVDRSIVDVWLHDYFFVSSTVFGCGGNNSKNLEAAL